MIRREIARRLESGAFDARAFRALSRGWAAIADPVRPLALPREVRVIGIGGATLGGSGKTPVALELARQLASEARVAVVASGYRARVSRIVRADDRVSDVGDEALMLARALGSVPVVVAKRRQAALAIAATLGELVIVDGLLQTKPVRLACSLLVLDRARPWGSERCPPAGDLRAMPARLLAACDAVLSPESAISGARSTSGEFIPVKELRARRLGLALAIARPERVLDALRDQGIEPVIVTLGADHGRPPAPGYALKGRVEAWLVTPKCATKLGNSWLGAPVWRLEQSVLLPPTVLALALGRPFRRNDRPVVVSAPCSSGEP